MGVYDIILIKKISCPQCGEEIDNFEFNTKNLINYSKLHIFKFPDFIIEEDGQILVEGPCVYCSGTIKGKVLIHNNLIKKITYWVENCPVKSISANFEDAFKEIKKADHDSQPFNPLIKK